jgi:hypothetical protein
MREAAQIALGALVFGLFGRVVASVADGAFAGFRLYHLVHVERQH